MKSLSSSFMNKKTFASILAVLSIVGYGALVFAVGPFAPGTILDPGCSPYINNDPLQGVDTDCTVLIGGGSVTATNGLLLIGSDVGLGGQLTQSTVIDQDSNDFVISDGFFSFGKVNDISLGTSLLPPAPFIGSWYNDGAGSEYASGYLNFMGMGAYFAGVQNAQYRNQFLITESNDGFKVDVADFVNSITTTAGFGTININLNHADGVNGTSAGLIIDTTTGITFSSELGSYLFPKGLGDLGDVLTSDGSGNLSWAPAGGGGSGPFSVQNSTSMFSTGMTNTGLNSTATGSFFVGDNAGYDSGGISNIGGSNFIGESAGYEAINAGASNFLGVQAGYYAANASNSNFIGAQSGYYSTDASNSNFIGTGSGTYAANASFSNFIGAQSGHQAANAAYSNFFGQNSGENAINAFQSNFIGRYSGQEATNANDSNFLGQRAGFNATNASHSFFVGENTGRYDQNALPIRGTPNAANSIFIGRDAVYTLADNGLNNTTNPDDFSILLGNYTSTGGFENSIALGQRATNTASNQFMVGSTTRRIETLVFNGGSGNTCSIVAGTGISCSSDERLKTNITDLDNTTLDKLLNIQTATYNWKQGINQNTQIGFIAQNINEYFPELVSINNDGMLAVNYAGMTPILTKAIQELDIKLTSVESFASDVNSTFVDSIRNWLASASNGIVEIFAGRIRTEELCVKKSDGTSVCMTGDELEQVLQGTSYTPSPAPIPSSESSLNSNDSELIEDGEIELVEEGSEIVSNNESDNQETIPEDTLEDAPGETVLDDISEEVSGENNPE